MIPNVYDDGSSSQYANGGASRQRPVLHCEVEGGGVQDFQNRLQALFWATVASLIAQEALAAAGLPFVSIAVSEFMAFLILLLSLIGFYASEGDRASRGPGECAGSRVDRFPRPGLDDRGGSDNCLRRGQVGVRQRSRWLERDPPPKSVQAPRSN